MRKKQLQMYSFNTIFILSTEHFNPTDTCYYKRPTEYIYI